MLMARHPQNMTLPLKISSHVIFLVFVIFFFPVVIKYLTPMSYRFHRSVLVVQMKKGYQYSRGQKLFTCAVYLEMTELHGLKRLWQLKINTPES